MNVIEVEQITKRYGPTTAIEDVSFEVVRGEIFGIVGPNGAGKTTMVEAIAGLRQIDSGRISVLDMDPAQQGPELRKRIGVQLQHAALQDRLKVWEALDLYASFYSHSVDQDELMAAWGLQEKRNAPFTTLSGGQKQRLFIALALINEPELVIFDELTSGLDPQSRRATWELVEKVREAGATVLLVTHFMDEAERLCDRIAVVDGGHIAALGSPSALISQYAHGSVIRFTDDDRFNPEWLQQLAGVEYVVREGSEVVVSGEGHLLSSVAVALAEHDHHPSDLRAEVKTLEDVFINLTGATLRD